MTKPELLRQLHELWEAGLICCHPQAGDRDASKVYAVIAHLYDWSEENRGTQEALRRRKAGPVSNHGDESLR